VAPVAPGCPARVARVARPVDGVNAPVVVGSTWQPLIYIYIYIYWEESQKEIAIINILGRFHKVEIAIINIWEDSIKWK